MNCIPFDSEVFYSAGRAMKNIDLSGEPHKLSVGRGRPLFHDVSPLLLGGEKRFFFIYSFPLCPSMRGVYRVRYVCFGVRLWHCWAPTGDKKGWTRARVRWWMLNFGGVHSGLLLCILACVSASLWWKPRLASQARPPQPRGPHSVSLRPHHPWIISLTLLPSARL